MKAKNADDIWDRLPAKLVKILMPFQRKGVEFAVNKNGRCLIADEMGLGKTLQAISVACYYRSEWPVLIIVPSSLRYCWIEEIERWLPDIQPGDINLVQSGSDVSEIGAAQVTIATFGLLSKTTSKILKEALFSQGFQVVIVDESHYIRNVKTVSAKTVVPLIKNANRRILLSGTPALSRPVELYPQIDAICPDKFGTWWSYTARYCDARLEWIGKNRRRNVNGASNLEELQHLLSSTLMIRREKSQVLTQLPPKQRQKVLFELKDSQQKKDIRETFDELRPLLKRTGGSVEKFEILTGGGAHDSNDTNTLALIQRLYQLSGEAKIGPAKEYVEMLCETPRLKFLVFAYHRAMMNGLCESLNDKRVKYIRIDGETPPCERPHLVHQFQSDPDTRVAVLSILAAGVGLTFTAATVVVFAEMYWTPGTMVQCEDRAHRIGQTNCVAVHYLVAKDTMDEWVWSAVCKKTIVTSTTLTGYKRKLEASEGDQYQVDVLSNADAWVPTAVSSDASQDSSILQSLQTQLDPDQPSILNFFGSSQKSTTPKSTPKHQKRSNDSSVLDFLDCEDTPCSVKPSTFITSDTEENGSLTPARKRRKFGDNFNVTPGASEKENMLERGSNVKKNSNSVFGSVDCILIESDEDDFVSKKVSPFKSAHSAVKTSSSKSSTKKSKGKQPQTPVSSFNPLKSTFANVKDGTPKCMSKDRNCRTGTFSQQNTDCTMSLSENSQWSCAACTFFNHKELTACEMCETPKRKETSRKVSHQFDTRMSDIAPNEQHHMETGLENRGFNESSSFNSNNQSRLNRTNISVEIKKLSSNENKEKEQRKVELKKIENRMPNIDADTEGRENDFSKRTVNDDRSKDEEAYQIDDFVDDHHCSNDGEDLFRIDDENDGNLEEYLNIDDCESPVSECVLETKLKLSTDQNSKPVRKTHEISDDDDDDDDSDDSCQQRRSMLLTENEPINCNDKQHDCSESNENLTTSSCERQSKYFCNKALKLDCQSPVVKKVKEVIIENTLKVSSKIVVNDKNVHEKHKNSSSSVEKSKDNDEKIAVLTKNPHSEAHVTKLENTSKTTACTENETTPGGSGKKYRFQSLKHRSSPVCTSPVLSEINSPISYAPKDDATSDCTKSEDNASSSLKGLSHNNASNTTLGDDNNELPFANYRSESDSILKNDDTSLKAETKNEFQNRSFTNGSSKDENVSFVSQPNDDGLNATFSSPEMDAVMPEASGAEIADKRPASPEKRVVNLDTIPVYGMFKYRCSQYTGRVYLMTKDGASLDVNFIPTDVEVGNLDALPDVLLHPSNLKLVQRFVREWTSLSETKHRLLVKSSVPFTSPAQEYERLRSCKILNPQRYKTKLDTSSAAKEKAASIQGSVRSLLRPGGQHNSGPLSNHAQTNPDTTSGTAQVISEDGTPHCLQCMKPYTNHLLQKSTIRNEENAWQTRFCSRTCAHDYWMLTNTEYIREKLFEAERGICQMCKLDAHSLYRHIKETASEKKRVEILGQSPLTSLSVKVKHQMVKKPTPGLFWHADHIVPVWEGGGQCDIDNLRTLCVKCHQKVTARQASKRANVRKLGAAAQSGDITAFFQKV